MRTIYVLFFIEIDSRQIHIAGCTRHPYQIWINQQTRQVLWQLDDQDTKMRFLIRDRDSKFSKSSDALFQSDGIDIIKTPIQAPNANAYAERWIRSVREECLDKLIVVNETHLKQVLDDYATYYNTARPHQGIGQKIPIARDVARESGPVRCRDVLGGIVHDYYRETP